MRLNKRSREERQNFQDANNNLISMNKEKEEEIRFLKNAFELLSINILMKITVKRAI